MTFFFFLYIATDIYQPLVPSYQTGISLVTTLFKKTCKYIFIFIHIFRYVHGTLGLAQVGSVTSEQCRAPALGVPGLAQQSPGVLVLWPGGILGREGAPHHEGPGVLRVPVRLLAHQ